MKAVYFEAHGEIDVLRYGEVPDPVAAPGTVVVRVKACALNYLDIWVRRGWPGLKLGIPLDYPGVRTAADQVLAWLTGESHRKGIRKINGLTRRCGSQEGNALAVCCRLGLIDDPRVHYLARSLCRMAVAGRRLELRRD